MRTHVIFLVVCMVCILNIPDVNSTIIRIRSCMDNGFMQAPPKTPPTTAAPPPTEPSTSTGASVATDPSATTMATTTTPAPVSSGGGGGGPESIVREWQVDWAAGTGNGQGTIIIVNDVPGGPRRCLRPFMGGLGITGRDSLIEAPGNFYWTFVSYFDSRAWVYRYQLRNNGNGRCLRSMGGKYSFIKCGVSTFEDLSFFFFIST